MHQNFGRCAFQKSVKFVFFEKTRFNCHFKQKNMFSHRVPLVLIFTCYLPFLYAQQGWQLKVDSIDKLYIPIVVAPNGNYVATGYKAIYTVNLEGMLVNKYDEDTELRSLIVMDDGNYVFTTRFFNGDSVRLVKINPSGEKIWERINFPWYVNLHFVFRTQDDNIIQVSPYDPIGAYETYVSKFTTSGDLIWTKYPNSPLGTFEAKKGIESLNNELFFIGSSGTPHNAYPKLVKTDGEGNVICITADGCNTSAILEHPDGGFLFACYDNNLLVTDSCGNMQQSTKIPGIFNIESMVLSDDGSLFIAGRLNQFDDFYFGKVNLDAISIL